MSCFCSQRKGFQSFTVEDDVSFGFGFSCTYIKIMHLLASLLHLYPYVNNSKDTFQRVKQLGQEILIQFISVVLPMALEKGWNKFYSYMITFPCMITKTRYLNLHSHEFSALPPSFIPSPFLLTPHFSLSVPFTFYCHFPIILS